MPLNYLILRGLRLNYINNNTEIEKLYENISSNIVKNILKEWK